MHRDSDQREKLNRENCDRHDIEPIRRSAIGPSSSPAMRCSPQRFSTASCTKHTSSTSKKGAIDSEISNRRLATSDHNPQQTDRCVKVDVALSRKTGCRLTDDNTMSDEPGRGE